MKRGAKQAASRLKYDTISYAVPTPLPAPLSTSATRVSTSGCWGDSALSARGIPTNPHGQRTRCLPSQKIPIVSLRGSKGLLPALPAGKVLTTGRSQAGIHRTEVVTVDTLGSGSGARLVLILFRPWGSAPSFLAAELRSATILSPTVSLVELLTWYPL